ncbi:MAG: hypothetical protein K1X81_06085 [Bacteroidia bacterium]|nr:hypothetical protein [Bacteroidia bacterium]
MRQKIHNAFANCLAHSCLQNTNESIFYIQDHPTHGRSFITIPINLNDYPYFTVNNPDQKDINFLSIDQCIYLTPQDGPRCDCALFDNTVFHFIEIKRGGPPKTSDRRRDAIDQLKVTIMNFIGQIDFSTHKIYAHICVGHFSQIPSIKTSDLVNSIFFWDNFKAELLDGNTITF